MDSLPAPYAGFRLMILLWFQECLDFCCIQLCPNPFASFSRNLWLQILSQKATERLLRNMLVTDKSMIN